MKFSRIHAICRYIRRKECLQCPHREKFSEGYGTRGCYIQAKEVMNIAKHGYPWKPPYNKRQRTWRSWWNREVFVKRAD